MGRTGEQEVGVFIGGRLSVSGASCLLFFFCVFRVLGCSVLSCLFVVCVWLACSVRSFVLFFSGFVVPASLSAAGLLLSRLSLLRVPGLTTWLQFPETSHQRVAPCLNIFTFFSRTMTEHCAPGTN